MKLFTIYQNHIVRDNATLINRVGWEEAAKVKPEITVARFLSFSSDTYEPKHFPLFKAVASVEFVGEVDVWSALEGVFAASNRCDSNYKNYGRAHSLSVGDIVETPEGEYYIVAGCGFEKVEVS